MWTVDITSPADIKLRMSQDLRGQSQIKRKWAPINDYWFFYNKTATSSLYWAWSWIKTGYKLRKMSCSMAQQSSIARKATYLLRQGEIKPSSGWPADMLCSCERQMTHVCWTFTLLKSFSAAQVVVLYSHILWHDREKASPWKQRLI